LQGSDNRTDRKNGVTAVLDREMVTRRKADA
jgi:hypothetical protein